MLESISLALQGLWTHKMRSFLTMLGVIIGVMSVIVLIAIGQGTTASVTESISSMGTNLLTGAPLKVMNSQLVQDVYLGAEEDDEDE